MVRRKSHIGHKLRRVTKKQHIEINIQKDSTIENTPVSEKISKNNNNEESERKATSGKRIRIVDNVQEIIVRGSFHQGDLKFSDVSRGRQCTANAAMAIVMSHKIQLGAWLESTIDNVLLFGDKLYIKSVSNRNIPDMNEINRAYLRVTELDNRVEIGGGKFELIIDEQLCIDGNIVQEFSGFLNLRNGLDAFFEEYHHGILTMKGMSLAIFHENGFFWIFDSHARGPHGRQSFGGQSAACLVRLDNLQALYDLLACNFSLTSSIAVINDCQYTITPVCVRKLETDTQNGDQFRLTLNRPGSDNNVQFRPCHDINHDKHSLKCGNASIDYRSVRNNQCLNNVQNQEQKKEMSPSTTKLQEAGYAKKREHGSQGNSSGERTVTGVMSRGSTKNLKRRKVTFDLKQKTQDVQGFFVPATLSPIGISEIRRTSESRPSDTEKKKKSQQKRKVLCTSNTQLQEQRTEHSPVESQNMVSKKPTRSEIVSSPSRENLDKHTKKFNSAIWKFADVTCSVCCKVFYNAQTCILYTTEIFQAILPAELTNLPRLRVCNRCATTLKKGKCPSQAYWNAMFLDPIPDDIACLTDIEKRLICMVTPFIRIIKLGGRFGQYGFRGQAVLFAQDVEEIIEQLPLSITSIGVAIVCEKLENVTRVREFQVNVEKLWLALVWLKENNPLYRNVRIDYGNTNFDISQICQVVDAGAAIINTCPQKITTPQNLEGIVDIKNARGIVRGSFHQGDEHFSEISRDNQGTANAAVAIVMAHLVPLNSWDNSTVDRVLISGDRLYVQSLDERDPVHIAETNRNYLTVTELHQQLQLQQHNCNLIIDDAHSVYGRLQQDHTQDGFPNLSNGLESFFFSEDYSAGILIVKGLSFAVFKMLNYWWMFDSHARGRNGRKAPVKGTACLLRFESVQSLFKLLKCNLPKSCHGLVSNEYSLTPVYPIVHMVSSQQFAAGMEAVIGDKSIIDEPAVVQQEMETEGPAERSNGSLSVMTSVLRPIDECIPQVASVICSADNDEPINNIPLRTLQRKTAPPLQMHVERRAEELGWFYLFPKGRNGLHEPTRQIPITPLDYCQARVMNADKRFQRNDYLFYALSVMEYYRARQNVGVCLRLRQGDTRPEGLVENVYLNMRGLRGSNAYWQTACSDLVAMVRNLGPPTWFITLSCNDLNWKDMLKACLVAAGQHEKNPEDLSWDDKIKLIEESPVTLARQFMVRINAVIQILKTDHDILGGKLKDYWWRIEFQNRGSPHLHMLGWIEGAPSFESPAGIELIDKIMSCDGQPQDKDLAAIVQRVQLHRHTQTCYKNRTDKECRFSFPRQPSESTKVLDADATIRNKGRFCIIKRKDTDVFVNNYNPTLIKLWGGNMDIQPCGSTVAIAYYIAKYASKHEPQDVGDATREAIRRVRRYGGDIGKQLFAVSMAILRYRQVSAPECAFRLCHLRLKDSSRKVVFVNTCRPEERYRILRSDGNQGQVHKNIFDRYISRPEDLEELSLAEFAVTYEPTTKVSNEDEDVGDWEAYGTQNERAASGKIIRLQNGMRMKERSRNAILKVRHYTQTGDREGYYYSYLVAHVPFRNEQDLVSDYETAEAAFNAKHILLRPLRHGGTVQEFQHVERELQQVIAQVLALEEVETHNPRDKAASETEINNQVEALVEGYQPGQIDIDMLDDNCANGDEPVITAEEFSECVRSMNVEQKRLFQKISNTIRDDLSNEKPLETLKLFITGGAGCGKTFLLKLIVHQIKICYAPTVDTLLDASFVEVCALTGVAARLVRGRTLHNAFSLGIEKGKASVYKQLTGERLEQLRRKWRYIRWLIIDEISMVSYEILRSVHLRLQELKNNTLLFGGVHILVFGDILQLPPVKGHWCFEQPAQYLAEPHLWRFFGLCELRANMRQQNDAPFVDLLNNLRVGELAMEQYEILLNRTQIPLVDEFADGEAVRIFPTLKLVDMYNNKIMHLLESRERMYVINARDESREPQTYGQKPPVTAVPVDPNNTGGFLSSITLAVGCRVMLRTNIRVTEGLVNGAMGIVRGFQWEALRRDQLENGELPKKVFIQFDDAAVGRCFKEANGFVGVSPVSVTYQGNRGFGNVERVMLPLILSWAVTVHKLQGTTVDKAVVYLGKKIFAKGQAYVALSRVRSMAGLVVCELDRKKLFNHPHDGKALKELQRLRSASSDI